MEEDLLSVTSTTRTGRNTEDHILLFDCCRTRSDHFPCKHRYDRRENYMLLNIFIGIMIVAAIGVGLWMAWFDSHGGKK